MLNYVEYGKENKYDDDIFFQKYSQMSRSQQGLAGAGEWETLRTLLPDFKDKRVLDLGCGYGWHCIYAMEHGASSVVGVDISHILGNLITVIFDYQILRKPLKILSL